MTTRRTDEETAWKTQRIVTAATGVFVKKGFSGATIPEIAAAAGYSPGALYRYFDSKEALFRAVVAHISERFLAKMREPLPAALSFEGKLNAALQRVFALADESRDIFVAIVAQRGTYDWDLKADLGEDTAAADRLSFELWSNLMAEGIAAGALRDEIAAAEHALAFTGIARAFMSRWLMTGETGALKDDADRVVDLFLRGAGGTS